MPRPRGMDTECYVNVFYVWAAFLVVLAVGLLALGSYAMAAEVNREAKDSIERGKSYHRICAMTEADNIEIINRRSPKATIIRFDGAQANLYTFFLQHGYAISGNNRRLSGGYKGRLPDGERLYIVDRTGRTSLYPFWIVDGCVAQVFYQIPRGLHLVILRHMKAQPA